MSQGVANRWTTTRKSLFKSREAVYWFPLCWKGFFYVNTGEDVGGLISFSLDAN